jgi:hypothetical protein
MAIRHDHALAVPGFYDHPIYRLSGNNATHEDRYNHAIRTMLQLYEEVSGRGFFSWPNDQVPPPTDPRFARFGEAMWKYIAKQGGEFCGEEISEDILPLAQAAGLCSRVLYDPAIHGEGIEADPGDEIWWWGDFDWVNEQSPSVGANE